MRRHVPAGLVLAVLASLLILLSDTLGLEVQAVALLGAGLGGALGLVPDRSPGQRMGAFAIGFGAAWIGYVLRAALLPDSASGRAVAVLVVILGCLAIATATRGRLPLWAALLGASAMAGAYESVYVLDPTSFLTTSPSSATAVLVAAAVGFIATVLLAPQVATIRSNEKARHAPGTPVAHAEPAPTPVLSIQEEAALLYSGRPLEPTKEA